MSMEGPLGIGLQGINRGTENLRKDAANLASANQMNGGADTPDTAESLVGLKKDQIQVQTSAKVVKAAEEMIGTLIDELA